MKTKTIFWAAAAAGLLLASCAKENDKIQLPSDESAIVKVTFGSTNTKAFDSTAQDDVLNDVVLYYSIDGKYYDLAAGARYINTTPGTGVHGVSGNVYSIEIPSNAQKLHVVGNLGAETNYPAATGLAAKTLDLANINKAAIWSYGECELTFVKAPDGSIIGGSSKPVGQIAEADVQMGFIPIRLDITSVNNMTDYDGTYGIIPESVAIIYSSKSTHVVPPYAPATPSYVSGLQWAGAPSGMTDLPDLGKSWTTPTSNSEETFYVLPSNDAAETITLVIEAKKVVDGKADTKVYFPVHFNGIDRPRLLNGKLYTMTLTLNGDSGATAAAGGSDPGQGGGTDNPEKPIEKAALTVEITAAQWDPLTIDNKIFQ